MSGNNIKCILTANGEGEKAEELAVTLDIFISSGLCLPIEIYDKAKDLRDELIRYAERIR